MYIYIYIHMNVRVCVWKSEEKWMDGVRGGADGRKRIALIGSDERDSPRASPLAKTMHPSRSNENLSQASTHRSAMVSLHLEPRPS